MSPPAMLGTWSLDILLAAHVAHIVSDFSGSIFEKYRSRKSIVYVAVGRPKHFLPRDSAECLSGMSFPKSRSAPPPTTRPVVLHNLLHHRQPHPRSIFLAVAHKRLEQPVAHRFRDSGTVILDANLQILALASQRDFDSSGFRRHRLARIQQQIQQGAFQLLEIEPALGRSVPGRFEFVCAGIPDAPSPPAPPDPPPNARRHTRGEDDSRVRENSSSDSINSVI